MTAPHPDSLQGLINSYQAQLRKHRNEINLRLDTHDRIPPWRIFKRQRALHRAITELASEVVELTGLVTLTSARERR